MSLEKTQGRVYLKDQPVDFAQIARPWKKAGFSVRFLSATFTFDDVVVSENGSFYFQDYLFRWLGYRSGPINGPIELKLVDEDFLPKKEAKEWQQKFKDPEFGGNQTVIHVTRES